jgi:gliding motility-associated-like protein
MNLSVLQLILQMFESKLLPVKSISMRRNPSVFFKIILFVVLIGSPLLMSAQNLVGHNWYFGNSTQAIRFNRVNNSPTLINNKAIPFGVGGSSVATDPITGNLLFYTDGSNIYDITNAIMPSGTGLGANTTANQPVAIAKSPGQKTQYYVFSNTASFKTGGNISYRIVDMAAFGNAVFPNPALGDAVGTSNTAVGGLTGRSEAMMTVRHANGEDFWLITHANGTADYSVTLFTAAGPQTTTNFTGLGLIEVAANFSFHPQTNRIATSPQETTRDIEIVNFNPTTGVLSFNMRVLNTGVNTATNQAIYDTEWSPNGQYLYVSRYGEPGIQADLMQYDLVSNFSTLTSVLPSAVFRSYGVQIAPDSTTIYHLYQRASGGQFFLGAILTPDSVASALRYNPTAFSAATDFLGSQFPSFAPKDSVLLKVNFTSSGTCTNSPTSFFPQVKPGADSLVWNFGDGTGSSEWSPVYTYTKAGTFNVKVKAYLHGDTASFTAPVTQTQFDLKITLVQDTTACACELPINNGKPTANPSISCPNDTSDDMKVKASFKGGTPTTMQWFGPGGLLPGQTTATLKPDSAGYYYLVATIGTCSAYAGVNIKEYDSLDQRANIWYFGKNAGIDFNPLPNDPAVAITGPLNTPEGCSVICDRNGQVIFSTDGQRIYDKDDVEIIIPVPPGLGGEPGSTQSAIIIPVPNDETLFYIFTTQEVHGTYTYECRYSLFDLKLNNGKGGLAIINQLLFTKSTERLTGNPNWLVAHEYGNNSFRAYNITSQGISNPVISSIGSDHSFTSAVQGQGYMKLGTGNRLAVALSTPGVSNVVELFDFIDSTGMVTNFRKVDLKSATGQVYGVEISPGGNKLFATLKNTPSSDIYEFSIDSLGNTHLKQKVTKPGEIGAMQTGPDGNIYVAINNSTFLGTFTANEDTTLVSSAVTAFQPFNLVGGTTSQLGLPNFTQILSNPMQQPGFSFTGLCLGDSTSFSATGKDPAIDKFDWNFGDGNSKADGGPSIKHLYKLSGTYTVNVKIYNKCEVIGTYTGTVIIRDKPVAPPSSVVMCTGDAVLDANPTNQPSMKYVWSTGDTTKQITVSKQAIYNVRLTDSYGCFTDAQILAADNRPKLNFGPDQTICQNVALAPLDAQNPGTTYSWAINSVPTGGTAQTQAVDTSLPGAFTYTVLVTDPITTCIKRDTITYTVKESPTWTATPVNPTSCVVNDGSISLNISAPTGALFTYSITGPGITQSASDQSPGVVINTPSTLDGGTYGITVADQVSGCATINTVTLNDPSFTVAAVTNSVCDPIALNTTITPTPGPLIAASTYRVINSGTLAVAQASTPVATGVLTFTTNALASNNQQYTVEVTNNGCVASSPPVTVNHSTKVPVTFATQTCSQPITITASTGTTFNWSGPGITGSSTGASITASPGTGSQTYSLLVKQSGFCDRDTTFSVFVEDIKATLTQSDKCDDVVTLTATPTGNYTYLWTRSGSNVPGGSQITIGLNDNNATYRVTVRSTVTACSSTATLNPQVVGDVRVTLLATNACEGAPFTITAVPNPATITTFAWTRDKVALPTTTAKLTDTKAGYYEATVNQSGCTATDYMNVILSPVTAGSLRDAGVICPDPANPDLSTRQITLDAGKNFLSYAWFKEGVALGATTQQYIATEAGNFSVDLVNTYGCASSDKTTLIQECDPRVTGPNAFRPTSSVVEGGDFTNRDFKVFTFFISDTDFQVFIFNRWGEMVYQSNDKNFRWNGGYNNNVNQPLPPGTYSYVVKYKSSYRPEDGVKETRGGVVLLR